MVTGEDGAFQFAADRHDPNVRVPSGVYIVAARDDHPEARIHGTVGRRGSGQAVAEVALLIQPTKDWGNLFGKVAARSEKDGAFQVGGLPAGPYQIEIDTPRGELPEWVAEPVDVAAEAGKTTSGVIVEVRRGGIVEVAVPDPRGNAIGKAVRTTRRSARSGRCWTSHVTATPLVRSARFASILSRVRVLWASVVRV